MPPAWLQHPSLTALPEHCTPSSPFLETISSLLQICLPSPLALISSTLGMLSILSWLFAQLPQIYKNYNIQSTAGLSIYFLVEWLLGDSTNLIGALFTRQAGWQIAIAVYYVTVDLVLVFQYYWYTHIKQWQFLQLRYARQDNQNDSGDSWASPNCVPIPSRTASCLSLPSATRSSKQQQQNQVKQNDLAGASPGGLNAPEEKSQPPSNNKRIVNGSGSKAPWASPRTIMLASVLCAVLANAASTSPNNLPPGIPSDHHSVSRQTIGRISSWISTLLYLGSRLPQLLKNYRRKSTMGLSPLLFLAAFCGNLFYSTSILTNPNGWSDLPPYGGGGWAGPDGNNQREWISLAIPFWLGAAGVLLLDATMGFQFLEYGEKGEEIVIDVPSRAARGHTRRSWKKVTGWMRGWIPSISSASLRSERGNGVSTGETQALLGRQNERYGGV